MKTKIPQQKNYMNCDGRGVGVISHYMSAGSAVPPVKTLQVHNVEQFKKKKQVQPLQSEIRIYVDSNLVDRFEISKSTFERVIKQTCNLIYF